MFYVYILKLSDNSCYKGLTEFIEKRLSEHEHGYVKTTMKKLPFKLVYVHICKDRIESRKIEKYFKSGFGREIIREIDLSN